MAKKPPKRPEDRRGFSLYPVIDDASRIIQRIGGRRGFVSAQMLTQWHVIVGSHLARNTLPVRIQFPRRPGGGGLQRENGILCLKAASAWATEIMHLAPLIIERVNTFFGYKAVSSIKLQHGPMPPSYNPPPPAEPPPEAVETVRQIVSVIENDQLRQVLEGLGRAINTPKPPPPPPPPRRVEAEVYRIGNKSRWMIPEEFQPPEVDLLVLRRLNDGRHRAIACYGWWDVATHVADENRARPEFWYFRAENLTPEDLRHMPADALAILSEHEAVIEICRRPGMYEYFAPIKDKVPTFDKVVRQWVKSQEIQTWIWSNPQSVRDFLAKHPPHYSGVRAVSPVAAELGWIKDNLDDDDELEDGDTSDWLEEDYPLD